MQEQAPFVHQLRSRNPKPPNFMPSDIQYLQRTAGNRAVQRLLQRDQPQTSTGLIQRTRVPDAMGEMKAGPVSGKAEQGASRNVNKSSRHVVQPTRLDAKSIQRTGETAPSQVRLRTTGGMPIQRSLKAYRQARDKRAYLITKLTSINSGGGSLRRKLGLRSKKKAVDSLVNELKKEPGAQALLDELIPLHITDYRTQEKAGAHEGLLSGSSDSEEYDEPSPSPSVSSSLSESSPASEEDLFVVPTFLLPESSGDESSVIEEDEGPSPSSSSGKKFTQGKLSKAMGAKAKVSELSGARNIGKGVDKVSGGSLTRLATILKNSIVWLEKKIASILGAVESDNGSKETSIWSTIESQFMGFVERAAAWANDLSEKIVSTLDPFGIVSSSIALIKGIYDAIKLGLSQDKQKTLLYRALDPSREGSELDLASAMQWALGQTTKRWVVMGRTLAAAGASFAKALTLIIPGAQIAAPFLTLTSALITYGPKIFNRIRQWYRDSRRTKKSMLNKGSTAMDHARTLRNYILQNEDPETIREGNLDMEVLKAVGMSPTDLMQMGSGGGKGAMVSGALKAKAKAIPGIGGKVSISDEEARSSGEETHIAKIIEKVVGHSNYDSILEHLFGGDLSEEEEESLTLLGGKMRSDFGSELSTVGTDVDEAW